jgi:acyl-homoserine-lactone acylase
LDILLSTIKILESKFSTWKIPWGEINRFQRNTGKVKEIFNDDLPSLPVGLASARWGCLPAFESRPYNNSKKQYGRSGNSFIAAVEFGKKVSAKTIVTGGQSSDPTSKHFADQASMYNSGQLKDVFFYKEDVIQHVEKQYHPGKE